MRIKALLTAAVGSALSFTLAACGLAGDSLSGNKAGSASFEPFTDAVPRAVCGPGSLPEPADGIQGEAPTAEPGYRCNVELVSNIPGTTYGYPSYNLAWYEDCAYYNTDLLGAGLSTASQNPSGATFSNNRGAVVVDATNPARPAVIKRLDSPAMLDPHESMKSHEQRALLGAVQGSDPLGNGPVFFDLYDVKDDCAQPVMKASQPMSIPIGHEGDFSADGTIYYASSLYAQMITPIDITDPARPLPISVIPYGAHGLATSDDGNSLYLASPGTVGTPTATSGEGLAILDTSKIQARAPAGVVSKIGEVTWTDGAIAQVPVPVTIGGKPFVIFVEEGGIARIIDVSDEKKPFIISELNIELRLTGTGSTHYCEVDQRHNPTVLGCSYWSGGSGMRVFDIRDPYHPKEIAYFSVPNNAPAAKVRFIKERGEAWFTDQNNGFYIVRFTNGVWPFKDGT